MSKWKCERVCLEPGFACMKSLRNCQWAIRGVITAIDDVHPVARFGLMLPIEWQSIRPVLLVHAFIGPARAVVRLVRLSLWSAAQIVCLQRFVYPAAAVLGSDHRTTALQRWGGWCPAGCTFLLSCRARLLRPLVSSLSSGEDCRAQDGGGASEGQQDYWTARPDVRRHFSVAALNLRLHCFAFAFYFLAFFLGEKEKQIR